MNASNDTRNSTPRPYATQLSSRNIPTFPTLPIPGEIPTGQFHAYCCLLRPTGRKNNPSRDCSPTLRPRKEPSANPNRQRRPTPEHNPLQQNPPPNRNLHPRQGPDDLPIENYHPFRKWLRDRRVAMWKGRVNPTGADGGYGHSGRGEFHSENCH